MTRYGLAQPRREDKALVRGEGRYTGDLGMPGMLHAAVVRSPYAHARIAAIDTAEAEAAPSVVAVFTAADLAAGGLGPLPAPVDFTHPDGRPVAGTPRPVLVADRARSVGDPIAFVVARTAAAAADAAALVGVDAEPLPAVSRIAAALVPGAPAVWDDSPGNVAMVWRKGDEAGVAAALAGAAHRIDAEIDISRVSAVPLEPRSSVGAFEEGRYVLRTSTQSPHGVRDQAARYFGLDPASVRVIAADVGGSFGLKTTFAAEDVLVLFAARRLGRPVAWNASRSEAFLADNQARDETVRTSLALDADGTFLAFSARCDVNIGAYMSGGSLPIVRNIGGIAGVYRTPALFAEVRAVFSNTVPTSAYRGAGRPEATYVLERTIDIAAERLGIDPFELRRRNLIPPEAMPYRTPLVFTYDCGDFGANMEAASGLIDYPAFAARRAASERAGRLRGIGIANPVEIAAGPIARPGADMARITVGEDGTFMLECGVMSSGQGLETAMTQVAADRLGISPDLIRYFPGDTDRLPMGRGNGGSASLAVGGSAVTVAVDALLDKARVLAAFALDAPADDLAFEDGSFRAKASGRRVALADLGRRTDVARPRQNDPPVLFAEGVFRPETVTYPNGCHICEVEIDPETGTVTVVDYVAVEDVGRVLNPLLVAGQMHGGIAQGLGQAIKERIVHDADGQVITGSFNDYAMPLATDLPPLRLAAREVPTAVNPLGAKGVGEAGTVGSLAAVMNAVCDALRPLGIAHVDMPASPARIWEAIRAAGN